MKRPSHRRPSLATRLPLTRPPVRRFRHILNALERQDRPTRRKLAEECEVTVKTIQRDIDFMRDQMNVPIEFDSAAGGYILTEPYKPGLNIQLSNGELISLLLTERTLDLYKGSPLEVPLRLAFEKLALALEGHISIPLCELGADISLRQIQPSRVDVTIFQTLATAIQKQRAVEITYTKLGDKKPKARKLEPYHLAAVSGAWYVIGHDLRSDEIRTFHLGRMQRASLLDIAFDRPKSFSAEKYLSGAFGIFRGKGDYPIILRFDPWAAQLIRERKIHPTQRVQEATDGGLELRLHLSSLEEIEPWILSWGRHIRVLAPKELIRRIRLSAEALEKNHAK